MNVLIACEESQTVCKAFRAKGHNAYSCDIIDPSGNRPEWHIKGDALKILNPCQISTSFYGIVFKTMDGEAHKIKGSWDLIIAHPPCIYLTVTGNRWFNAERYGDKAIQRIKHREEAAKFFMQFVNANCEHIVIENPVGYMSTAFRKPDQIIQPYMFGDAFEKKTCLWLKNLPLLKPTNIVEPPKRTYYKSGKSMPAWYADAWKLPKDERSKLRSKTFKGIAAAMAEQWGVVL